MSNEDSKKQPLETRQLHGTPYQVIVQKHHAYNLDTILLAHFASSRIKKSKKIVDLGTGNGILMLYLSLYTNASLTGYDITASHIEIANQNIEINQLDLQIKAFHKDITTMESFDCDTIITNPPYFKYQEHTNISKHPTRSIARFEITLTLNQVLGLSSKSLKTKQSLFMIHRSERIDEIITLAKQYQLTIKEMQCIHPYIDQPSEVVLLHFVKDAKHELLVLPPLILYDAKHQFSLQLEKIYEGVSHVT
jgi:tRNA1(Val) A37 N6-methylase TrmN6